MLKRYLKQAPTVIVIGVAGFAAWPALFPEKASPPSKGATRPPSKAGGTPSLVGASDRDPFLVAGLAKATAAPTSPLAAKAPGSQVEKSAATAELQVEEDNLLNGMRLGGTFVGGREQLAIIDGKVYARGERLRHADGSPLPYVVLEVRKDRAVLRRAGKDFVLGFSDAPRKAAKVEGRAVAKSEAPAKAPPTPGPEVAATRGKKGPSPSNRPGSGGDDGNPASTLLKLLPGINGGSGAGGASPSGTLAGLGQAGGANPGSSGLAINPTNIQAGLDALMGKYDNIGRAGDTSGASGGTSP